MTGNIKSAEQPGKRKAAVGQAHERADAGNGHPYALQGIHGRRLFVIYNADTSPDLPPMERPPPAPTSRRSQGLLDRSVQGQIGRMLRDLFADVAEEPVPARFIRLLEALECKEKQP
jgi:hypothetical protein